MESRQTCYRTLWNYSPLTLPLTKVRIMMGCSAFLKHGVVEIWVLRMPTLKSWNRPNSTTCDEKSSKILACFFTIPPRMLIIFAGYLNKRTKNQKFELFTKKTVMQNRCRTCHIRNNWSRNHSCIRVAHIFCRSSRWK